MPTCPTASRVAVVIATRDRPATLADRALRTVAAQTRRPDYLVVVDDARHHTPTGVREIVDAVDVDDCVTTYIRNARTPGASGAWNSALDHLLEVAQDAAHLFVAFLDDDDAWDCRYLERCYSHVRKHGLDMVASDFRRIEELDEEPLIMHAPEMLRASDFLTGNPGIQGSNLFLRLSALLAAGGFDEELRSSTDRDLCIRLADLRCVRYDRLPRALVDHFAEPGRPRLSTRGSRAKLEGLTSFWNKYVGRMTLDQEHAFCERAKRLFDWLPPSHELTRAGGSKGRKVAIVLGLAAQVERSEDLLTAVQALANCTDPSVVGLDVVLLECGHCSDGAAVLDDAAANLRDAGIGCFRATAARSSTDAGDVWRSGREGPGHVAQAAEERGEMLQRLCGRVAGSRPGVEVWVADADASRSSPPADGQMPEILGWLSATPAGDPASNFADDEFADLDDWFETERVTSARHRVSRRFSPDRLRVLGSGSEAIVLTDDRIVYKCFDYWKSRLPEAQLEFLQSQVGRWDNTPGLYSMRELTSDGPWAILSYDYEPSAPYRGGHETDIVRLLDGCCRVGIVCNNVHPKNLIVTAAGVKLIDYGADIRPWSPLGFEHMARRAYISCRFAQHPDLKSLMRRALTDDELPELTGYQGFLAQVGAAAGLPAPHNNADSPLFRSAPPTHAPFSLYVGVITSDPRSLRPLLHGLATLADSHSVSELRVLVLDNGSPNRALKILTAEASQAGLQLALVTMQQQQADAVAGSFGQRLIERPLVRVGIAHARTMVQRYVGALMESDPGSIGWILDDDMRIDARVLEYMPWLPAFREQGVHVLLGAYEGASPNPPINGLRVQLVDLFHNLLWLRKLDPAGHLPDRSKENEVLRRKYPDYYYDLSRKHTGHLEMPHWLEPAFQGETVREAYQRLIHGARAILKGNPLTRPLLPPVPENPLQAATDSVNRGGITFVLDHRALTLTPNSIPHVDGYEARRSDMIWAIVNRYHRGLTMKATGFPINHACRYGSAPDLDIVKVQGEIMGSALYGALTEFLASSAEHTLAFSEHDLTTICDLTIQHQGRRLRALSQSVQRVMGLRSALGSLAKPGELDELLSDLDRWFTPANLASIEAGVCALPRRELKAFLTSLRQWADDYAAAAPASRRLASTLEAHFRPDERSTSTCP